MTTTTRSRLIAAAAALPLVGAALLLSGPAASAEPSGGAIQITAFTCNLADGNLNYVTTSASHAVITPIGGGLIECRAQVPASVSGRAVRYDYASTGQLCQTPAGYTAKWSETVSAAGQADLRCNFAP
jgi:hypothetical protein